MDWKNNRSRSKNRINQKKMNEDRMKSLEWWRNLTNEEKIKICESVNRPFAFVDTSSSTIERIWKSLNQNKDD